MSDDLAQYLDSLQREERYRVEKVLKASAFETTQRVWLMKEDGSEDGPFIRKFIKREMGLGIAYERIFEAQRSGCVFEHLPRVFECYPRDDELVVVMEFVEGETLQDLIYRLDPSIDLARVVFPLLCDAVCELHEKFDPPLIHRDLKPSNIIVSVDESPRSSDGDSRASFGDVQVRNVTIIDFGIAREVRAGAETDTAHFGTRDFAPPEQYGYGQTTVCSDVYALGMLLFFCLTETIPTQGVREAGFSNARVPESLRRLIVQATSFDPTQRFNSASALKAAFENVIDGKTVRPISPSVEKIAQPDRVYDEGVPRGVIGRIVAYVWNPLVVAFCSFIIGYSVYLAFTTGLMSPEHVVYSPLGNVISLVLSIVLAVLLCFACLDKSRLRRRYPALRHVKAWHCWLLLILAYVVATSIRGIIS